MAEREYKDSEGNVVTLDKLVTVTSCNGTNRCDVVNEAGESAYFALTCGAARLEPVTDESRED